MKRIVAMAAVAAAALSLSVPAVASASAPPKCGNYMEEVPGSPHKFHGKYYWGNCTDDAVLIDVWRRGYSFEYFDRQICAPAQEATLLGETTNYIISGYSVKKTSGPC